MRRWNCKNVYDGRAYAFEAVGNYEFIKYLGSSNFHSYISRGEYSLRACSSIHRRNSKIAKLVREREHLRLRQRAALTSTHILALRSFMYTFRDENIVFSAVV